MPNNLHKRKTAVKHCVHSEFSQLFSYRSVKKPFQISMSEYCRIVIIKLAKCNPFCYTVPSTITPEFDNVIR